MIGNIGFNDVAPQPDLPNSGAGILALDVTTGLSWAAYANPALRATIEPMLTRFLNERGGVME